MKKWKDIKCQNKTKKTWSKLFLGFQCDWCSSGCSSSIQQKPASGLIIALCPPWLCVLSSVWQATSASLQPPATGLAQLPVSLPQWDLMDSHQEAVNQATILGSLCCLWESLTGEWVYQQWMCFFNGQHRQNLIEINTRQCKKEVQLFATNLCLDGFHW